MAEMKFDMSKVVGDVIEQMENMGYTPIKHGRWIGVDYDMFYECSECGQLTDWKQYKYCPYCGARMDLNE